MNSGGPLFIDVGGSRWRAEFRTDGVSRSAVATALPPILEGQLSPLRVRTGLDEILKLLDIPNMQPSVVAMATTGMARLPGEIDLLHDELRITDCVASTVVVSDAAAGLAGAVGTLDDGCLLSVGTGVAAVSRSPTGEWAFKDGWGPLLGDEGGGYWIGSHGLRAALRARDNRSGGSEQLSDMATQRFGKDVKAWPLRGDLEATVQEIASFSNQVLGSAIAGDEPSLGIVGEACSRLVDTAAAISYGRTVHIAGGMVTEPFFRETLVEKARSAGINMTDAQGDTLSGLGLIESHGVDSFVLWSGDLISRVQWT